MGRCELIVLSSYIRYAILTHARSLAATEYEFNYESVSMEMSRALACIPRGGVARKARAIIRMQWPDVS